MNIAGGRRTARTIRSVVFDVTEILIAEITPHDTFLIILLVRHSHTSKRLGTPLLWYIPLVRLFDSAISVHAKGVLVPERTLAVEVDLVMSEERVVDETVYGREELVVEALDRLVGTMSRFYRSRRLGRSASESIARPHKQ